VVRRSTACSIFFFQAEDGIRDPLVTGVQTCALPIFEETLPERALVGHDRLEATDGVQVVDRGVEAREQLVRLRAGLEAAAEGVRSEERRVGKEWRRGRSWEESRKSTQQCVDVES